MAPVAQDLQMDKSHGGDAGITGLYYHTRVSVKHSNIDEMSAIALPGEPEYERPRAELKLCDRGSNG